MIEVTPLQSEQHSENMPAQPEWISYSPQRWCRQFSKKASNKPLNRSDLDVLRRLAGTNEVLKKHEIMSVYSPLAGHILSLYRKHRSDPASLHQPFVVGISGSVAVGKSTGARVITELLRRESLSVEMITTDNFLKPNWQLEQENKLRRKGFPESYDETVIAQFLQDLNSNKPVFTIPTYDHIAYTILPEVVQQIYRPDIVVLEGVNVLQRSDFKLNFSLFFEADPEDIKSWYIKRFLSFRNNAFAKPGAYFHRFATLTDKEAFDVASELWNTINLVNLQEHIAPSKVHADCVMNKSAHHAICSIQLIASKH